jgi:uncharacterized protein (TIGR03435 family)
MACALANTTAWGQGSGMAAMPTYDAVSIKPNKAGDGRVMVNQGQDRYAGTNVTLKQLLRYAYNLTTDEQISGLPGWAESDHWDVEAKLDAETVAVQKKMSKDDSAEQRRQMMRAMLEDRFKLKVHHEQKELTVYNLVLAKGGSKLKESDPEAMPADAVKGPDGKAMGGMMRVEMGKLTAQSVPISNLAMFLAQTLHKQVIDKTGLTGKYDMSLMWLPDDLPPGSHEATGIDGNAPSIYTALQEQLGLRLDSVKGPVDTIVVDHVEVASEN